MLDNPDSGAADKLAPAHPICCTLKINSATHHMLLKAHISNCPNPDSLMPYDFLFLLEQSPEKKRLNIMVFLTT